MPWSVTLVADVESGRMTEHEIPSSTAKTTVEMTHSHSRSSFKNTKEHEERRPRPVLRSTGSTGRRTSSKAHAVSVATRVVAGFDLCVANS
jgi:hypothetical protein